MILDPVVVTPSIPERRPRLSYFYNIVSDLLMLCRVQTESPNFLDVEGGTLMMPDNLNFWKNNCQSKEVMKRKNDCEG